VNALPAPRVLTKARLDKAITTSFEPAEYIAETDGFDRLGLLIPDCRIGRAGEVLRVSM
jgi:hypothetical protein